jgi:methylphosphotriester-DNA--protein-cysteine methyltransferase
MMRFQVYDIDPRLQPYIKLICTMECHEDIDTNHIRVLPDTCVELFINYTNSPIAIIGNSLYQRSIVSFRMSRPMDVQMRKGSGCLAICFHPGMAYALFHIPMHLLSDTTTALADLWRNKAVILEDQLANAHSNEMRVQIAQRYLLQEVAISQVDPTISYCLQQIEQANGLITLDHLTKKIGFSQRQLSRKFQQFVGLSPKAYLKVNRFIRSLHHLKDYPARSLTEIGYESGYYDQAHFNHDYQFYTGYSPREVTQASDILY